MPPPVWEVRALVRRKRLLSPRQLKTLAREMKDTLDKLIPEYVEAFEYTHGRRDGHHQTDEEREQSAEVGRVRRLSDPTGEIVSEQESNRRRLAVAGEKLDRAAKDIDSAVAHIKNVFSSPDDYFEKLEGYKG